MRPLWQVEFHEDESCTVLARLCARDGSGDATGEDGEGNWLEQADFSTITCAVYDVSSDTPNTAIATPTVTIATHVLDTPVTTAVIWTRDTVGYNFAHDLPKTAFPTGNNEYEVVYTFTLTGGTVFHLTLTGQATSVRGS